MLNPPVLNTLGGTAHREQTATGFQVDGQRGKNAALRKVEATCKAHANPPFLHGSASTAMQSLRMVGGSVKRHCVVSARQRELQIWKAQY